MLPLSLGGKKEHFCIYVSSSKQILTDSSILLSNEIDRELANGERERLVLSISYNTQMETGFHNVFLTHADFHTLKYANYSRERHIESFLEQQQLTEINMEINAG